MSENHPQIAPPTKSRTPLLVGIAVLAIIAVVGGFLWSRGGDDAGAASGEKSEKVVLGTVGASDPYWQVLVDAAADEGIDLEVKDFADYTQPNPALSEGELDINQFQHLVYLAEYNVANDDDIVPLGSTAIYPLGLYSSKVDAVEDPNALPYVNVFAVRAEDRDDPTLLKLVKVYQETQAVLDGVQDVSGGTAELVKVPQDELQASLDDVEADTAAQK